LIKGKLIRKPGNQENFQKEMNLLSDFPGSDSSDVNEESRKRGILRKVTS
jgi:hypothetical protein